MQDANRFNDLEPVNQSTTQPKKKSRSKKKGSQGFTTQERKEANERMAELAPDFSEGGALVDDLAANMGDLESAQAVINEQLAKVATVILTDFSPQNELQAEKDIFKALRNACKRAGMLDKGNSERDFFKIIYDPKFQLAVRQLGTALVGMHILPILAVVLDEAIVKRDKTCLGWALEMMGLKRDKYQFALDRRQIVNINAGNEYNVNFEDKSDEELKRIADGLDNVTEAEVVSSQDNAGKA